MRFCAKIGYVRGEIAFYVLDVTDVINVADVTDVINEVFAVVEKVISYDNRLSD